MYDRYYIDASTESPATDRWLGVEIRENIEYIEMATTGPRPREAQRRVGAVLRTEGPPRGASLALEG